jgi:hypothetical protein
VHRVLHDVRRLDGRRGQVPTVLGLVAVLALATTACGPDLGKSNFARTTVPATAAAAGTDGPITDPAVAAQALRVVKPCQFLARDVLAPIGTADDDPSASSVSFDSCRNSVKDPGGKTVGIQLEVGTLVPEATTATAGTVGGLPLVVAKGTNGSCVVAALTARSPNLGVRLSIDYAGGDGCRAGQTLIDAVVKKLHDSPEKYDAAQATVLTADPCRMLDASAVEAQQKSAKPSPVSTHSCDWKPEVGGATITVTLRPGLAPIEGDGWQKVDIGSGVSGFKKPGTGDDCTVQWKHRPWTGDAVEIVQVQYVDYTGSAARDDPCGKALPLAWNAFGNLPKA